MAAIRGDGSFELERRDFANSFVLENTPGFIDKTTYVYSEAAGNPGTYFRIPDSIDLAEFDRRHRQTFIGTPLPLFRFASAAVEGRTTSLEYLLVPTGSSEDVARIKRAIEAALAFVPALTAGNYTPSTLLVDGNAEPGTGRVVFSPNPDENDTFRGSAISIGTEPVFESVGGGVLYPLPRSRALPFDSVVMNFTHELGHVFFAPGHATPFTSIMGAGDAGVTESDRLFAKIVYRLRRGNTTPDIDAEP